MARQACDINLSSANMTGVAVSTPCGKLVCRPVTSHVLVKAILFFFPLFSCGKSARTQKLSVELRVKMIEKVKRSVEVWVGRWIKGRVC